MNSFYQDTLHFRLRASADLSVLDELKQITGVADITPTDDPNKYDVHVEDGFNDVDIAKTIAAYHEVHSTSLTSANFHRLQAGSPAP